MELMKSIKDLIQDQLKKTKKTITLEWYKHLISSPELTDQVKMYDTIL